MDIQQQHNNTRQHLTMIPRAFDAENLDFGFGFGTLDYQYIKNHNYLIA